jgi:hypothetical protein
MSDTMFGLLFAKRSLMGVLLGSAKSIARFRLRRWHVQILGEGLNCSEIEVAGIGLAAPKVAVWPALPADQVGGEAIQSLRGFSLLTRTPAKCPYCLESAFTICSTAVESIFKRAGS